MEAITLRSNIRSKLMSNLGRNLLCSRILYLSIILRYSMKYGNMNVVIYTYTLDANTHTDTLIYV